MDSEPNPLLGFNSRTKQFENLIEAGVIDPVKVVMNSLQFASGVAGILLTADVSIVNEPLNKIVRVHEEI